ncbi:hypothetical protein EBR96_06920 [bacterium]|nr:hypothetical protein [bacterium]
MKRFIASVEVSDSAEKRFLDQVSRDVGEIVKAWQTHCEQFRTGDASELKEAGDKLVDTLVLSTFLKSKFRESYNQELGVAACEKAIVVIIETHRNAKTL